MHEAISQSASSIVSMDHLRHMTLRFAIVYPRSLTYQGGGTVGCIEIARQFERMGHEVFLIPVSRAPVESVPGYLGGIVPVPPSRFHYLMDGIGVARAVLRLAASRPLDAVFAWGPEAAFLPPLIRRRRFPLCLIAARPYRLWWERPSRIRSLTRHTDRWFVVNTMQHADIVFALSQFTRLELTDLFHLAPQKVVVAHWGVASEFTCIPRPEPKSISRLIFFGSLETIKGVFDAVRVLALLQNRGHSMCELRIAGWGNVAAVLRLAAELGVSDSVRYLGALDRPALLQELRTAHLALLPSHSESFGLAIAEAQAAGLPVVSYSTGAIPEVVEHGTTGWLVPPGDIHALADAVVDAMDHPAVAHARGLAGRHRILHHFTWQRTVSTMLGALGLSDESRRSHASSTFPTPLAHKVGSVGGFR